MKSVQIDVTNISDQHVTCNLYTGSRCVKLFMHKSEYNNLCHDRFFIRDGKKIDSAGVINTTNTYCIKPNPEE